MEIKCSKPQYFINIFDGKKKKMDNFVDIYSDSDKEN